MHTIRLAKTALAFVAIVVTASAAAADWLQFGFDQAHSGNNGAETGYSTSLGNRLVFSSVLPNSADSAPVFLSNVATSSGNKNILFISALNGTLMAINAADGSLVWSQQASSSVVGAFRAGGVNGSPAIDPSLLFVYSFGMDGNVRKYQVGDGTEVLTGGWPESSTVKPELEKSSAGLAIATPSHGPSYLYSVVSGYYGDIGDYQGHVTSIDLSSGTQTIFNSQCSNLFIHFVKNGTAGVDDCNYHVGGGYGSGIWGRPGAIYDEATNKIYIATGNGIFDANASTGDHYAWGDSLLALNPDGTGSGLGLPVDSYTPTNYTTLYNSDIDLGATSMAILPSTSAKYPHLGMQSGKDGCMRLINLDDMSGAAGPGHVGGEINSAVSCTTNKLAFPVLTQPAVWIDPSDKSTWFFVANGGGLFAIHLTFDGSGNPSLAQPLSAAYSTLHAGTSPAIANGEIYYASSSPCPAPSCSIYAVDAATGAVIWQSGSLATIHWQSPIVVNGRVYLIDYNGTSGKSTLWVYELDGIFRNGFQ